MNEREPEVNLIDALQADMLGRRGFRQNWDQIDEEIRDEIEGAWRDIARRHLERAQQTEREAVLRFLEGMEEGLDTDVGADVLAAAIHEIREGNHVTKGGG